MKCQLAFKIGRNSFSIFSVVLFFSLLLFNGCKDEPVIPGKDSQRLVISDYILENTDQFSEFNKLLENTGLNSLLSIRGPFTLLLPTDDAMKAYLAANNLTSVNDLTTEQQKQLVYNHLIATEIQTSDIGLGALRQANALGDNIATEFHGADIYFNKSSKLIKRDIRAANGYIHLIDKVIDIISLSIYDKLASMPDFSIFTRGIEKCELKDTLQLIEFPYNVGGKLARTHFTILAVPDSVFISNGINSVDDLINKLTDKPGEIQSMNNEFYRFMEYHCMSGTYFLSDLPVNDGKPKLYPILSYDNNVSITITNDYKLNYDKTLDTYTGFIIEESNYSTKNGALHAVNGLLEVIEPEPAVLIWEPTDYFDMKQGDYYGKYYKKWFDGQNTFANIKWEGDYLLYYYKNHDTGKLLNDDCLSMSGYWWVEVTTPKIMKGSYIMTGNIWSGNTNYEVYVDGVRTATIKSSDAAEATTMAEVTWDTTKEHKVKIVTLSWGMLFFDTLIFTPAN